MINKINDKDCMDLHNPQMINKINDKDCMI